MAEAARQSAPSPFVRDSVRPFRTAVDSTVAVSDCDVDEATARVVRQFEAQRDHIRVQTWLIGLLPVLYGILTWTFGDTLWASSPIYRTALAMPYAPQSWGVAFIVMGVLTVWFSERCKHRADMVACLVTAFVLAGFMASFVIVAVEDRTPGALPPAVIYALFALLYMNRAWLAWKSRT